MPHAATVENIVSLELQFLSQKAANLKRYTLAALATDERPYSRKPRKQIDRSTMRTDGSRYIQRQFHVIQCVSQFRCRDSANHILALVTEDLGLIVFNAAHQTTATFRIAETLNVGARFG